MPAVSGVTALVKVGNEVQILTPSGSGTFTVTFGGQTTGALTASTLTAAALQTALTGLTSIGASNVSVAGSTGGPWTVTFQGALAGQNVATLVCGNFTGGLTVATSQGTTVYTTAGGQRKAKLTRTTKDVDSTSKDSAGWEENIPTFRGWQLDFDGLLLETDADFLALEAAYLNNNQVLLELVTPAGHSYSGFGTLSAFPVDVPHDNVATISCTVKGTTVLTKV